MARTLEREWNERLADIERMERDATLRPQLASRLVDPQERCRVLALAQDLSKVWHAPTTPQTARKQLLGYLIKDVTLCRGETLIQVAIRWQTEACTVLEVPRPKRTYEVRRTDPVVVARVRALAPEHTDRQIAALLDQEGFRSGTKGSFTADKVQWIRYKHSIPSGCPDGPAACRNGSSRGRTLYGPGSGRAAEREQSRRSPLGADPVAWMAFRRCPTAPGGSD